jgi:hypothetical protein
MTFFQEPVQIIAGKIRSPILEINNEKIAMRHLNSIVVAWFFKKKPSYFDGNTKKIVESDMREELRSMLEEKPAEQDDNQNIQHTRFLLLLFLLTV